MSDTLQHPLALPFVPAGFGKCMGYAATEAGVAGHGMPLVGASRTILVARGADFCSFWASSTGLPSSSRAPTPVLASWPGLPSAPAGVKRRRRDHGGRAFGVPYLQNLAGLFMGPVAPIDPLA